MQNLKIFISLSIILFAFGCRKDDSSTNQPIVSDFTPLPLNVGNTWIYRNITPNGTIYDTMKIVRTSVFKSQTTYVLNNDWFWDNDGLFYIGKFLNAYRVGYDTTSEIIFPENPEIGQTWIVDQDMSFKLESKSESITVPAGSFNCCRLSIVRMTNPADLSATLWWASGVGWIKMTSTNEELVLMSKTLN